MAGHLPDLCTGTQLPRRDTAPIIEPTRLPFPGISNAGSGSASLFRRPRGSVCWCHHTRGRDICSAARHGVGLSGQPSFIGCDLQVEAASWPRDITRLPLLVGILYRK